MIPLWHSYWPVVVIGLVAGIVAGTFFFRPLVVERGDKLAGLPTAVRRKQKSRRNILFVGIAGSLLFSLLWHGPLGAGSRFADKVEAATRAELRYQEMGAIEAKVERAPLSRQLVLSGPADDFQQRELVRILGLLPGVSGVRWASPPRSPDGVK